MIPTILIKNRNRRYYLVGYIIKSVISGKLEQRIVRDFGNENDKRHNIELFHYVLRRENFATFSGYISLFKNMYVSRKNIFSAKINNETIPLSLSSRHQFLYNIILKH